MVPDDRVTDVAALGAAFATQYPSWHGDTTAILNPKFEGSFDIRGADADFIADGCLWDIKTTIGKGGQGRYLYQVLGYLLLDYEDEYAIERVGLVFPRQNTRVYWSADELMAEMSGRDDLNLADLRRVFRTVCESLDTGTGLDPRTREKGLAAYQDWVRSIEAKGNSTVGRRRGRSRRARCEACGRRRVLRDWSNGTDPEAHLCSECLGNQRVSEALGTDAHCQCGAPILPLNEHAAYCFDAIRHNWPRRSAASMNEVSDLVLSQPDSTARALLVFTDETALERADGQAFTVAVGRWLCSTCGQSASLGAEGVSQFFTLLEAHHCESA